IGNCNTTEIPFFCGISVFCLFEIPYARLKEVLILVALDVDGDVAADSLAVTHLAEDSTVGAEYALDSVAGRIRVVADIHSRISVEVAVLRSYLTVCRELSNQLIARPEASLAVRDR